MSFGLEVYCSGCGAASSRVEERLLVRLKDLPRQVSGSSCAGSSGAWCAATLCPVGAFTSSPLVPARSRLTTRLREKIRSAFPGLLGTAGRQSFGRL